MGRKNRNKKKNSGCCNKFNDFKLPPCAKFLGNINPFVKDGKIIYRNNNRVYFFLTYNYTMYNNITYNPLNPATFNNRANSNIQIEPYYFIIGLYINEVQKGNIKFNENVKIHDNTYADGFIKNVLGNEYEINNIFIPSLTYMISNASAVIPFFVGTVEISLINYYIILMISRFYSEYGLLFSDNAYVTNDFINNALASMYVEFNNY